MSDRKYRQSGYQDQERPERERLEKRREKPPGAPRTVLTQSREGPRSPQMPGRRGVSRCAGCGVVLPPDIDPRGQCPRCQFELHSCKQCVNFDTGQRFECLKPITARIPRKDGRNECSYYQMKVTVEKETSSAMNSVSGAVKSSPSSAAGAREAFENLFRK